MWSAEVGGSVHSKNRLVSSRKHRATEVRKLRFLSSCQYTHGCCAPASWAARHTTVCLDLAGGAVLVGEGGTHCLHNWINKGHTLSKILVGYLLRTIGLLGLNLGAFS